MILCAYLGLEKAVVYTCTSDIRIFFLLIIVVFILSTCFSSFKLRKQTVLEGQLLRFSWTSDSSSLYVLLLLVPSAGLLSTTSSHRHCHCYRAYAQRLRPCLPSRPLCIWLLFCIMCWRSCDHTSAIVRLRRVCAHGWPC